MVQIFEVMTTRDQLTGTIPLRGAHVYHSVDGYSVILRWLKRDKRLAQAVADDLGEQVTDLEYSRAVVRRWGMI